MLSKTRRLWPKKRHSELPGDLEISVSASMPPTLNSARTSSEAATAGSVQTPPTPQHSSGRRIRLPPLFSARRKNKKQSAAAPVNRTFDEESLLAMSAPHDCEAPIVEDTFDEELAPIASSLDAKTKKSSSKKVMNASSSKSELSMMTALMMNEEVKAKLQIQDKEETRNKVPSALKLTEEPYNSSSGSALDVLINNNGKKQSSRVRPEVRRTALHSAVELGASVEIVSRLTESLKSIDLFAVTEDGDTALHLAARNRNAELCIFLINLGCDPNLGNLSQKTAVQLAGSELGYMMILTYWSMLKSRVELNTYGDIAAQATRYNSVNMLKELAELGADLNSVRESSSGLSLAEIARQSGHVELATALDEDSIIERARNGALPSHASSGNVSFSGTSSLRKMYGASHAHKHSSSGILDLPSDEVKALIDADTGTDVLNSPVENANASLSNVQIVGANANAIQVSHARQISQDLELSPDVEYDENVDIAVGVTLGHRVNALESLHNLTNAVAYEKRASSRFMIRDLD